MYLFVFCLRVVMKKKMAGGGGGGGGGQMAVLSCLWLAGREREVHVCAERGFADSLLPAYSQRYNLKTKYKELNCFININLYPDVFRPASNWRLSKNITVHLFAL